MNLGVSIIKNNIRLSFWKISEGKLNNFDAQSNYQSVEILICRPKVIVTNSLNSNLILNFSPERSVFTRVIQSSKYSDGQVHDASVRLSQKHDAQKIKLMYFFLEQMVCLAHEQQFYSSSSTQCDHPRAGSPEKDCCL